MAVDLLTGLSLLVAPFGSTVTQTRTRPMSAEQTNRMLVCSKALRFDARNCCN